MRIKHRLERLEKDSGTGFEVLVPLVVCSETERGLTEASGRAKYVAGTVTQEFGRQVGEDLVSFKDRVREEGGRLMRAAHPNAILVYAGVMGSKYRDCR